MNVSIKMKTSFQLNWWPKAFYDIPNIYTNSEEDRKDDYKMTVY